MSMQRGCLFIERDPSKWFAVVAVDEGDYEFTKHWSFGPHDSVDAAMDEMGQYVSNPGSFRTIPHADVNKKHRELCNTMCWSRGPDISSPGAWL